MTITQLGKYEIIEKLGEGATSEVFHARDKVLGREVALKVLKPSLVADSSAFARFVQEAQAAAGLFHPNIATVLDMDESEGSYFIAMRYIPGRSLDQELKAYGPLAWEQVVRMAQQLGDALETAHTAGFIHRDVKPGNVIWSTSSNFFMTDFGLVRAMENTGFTSHSGAMIGTPQYIAPEIWNGGQASPLSDQYALACVVFEAVMGRSLFEGSTTQEIITKHLIKPPSISDPLRADLPAGLSAVLRQALDKEPSQRYETISDFTRALASLEMLQVEEPSVEVENKVHLPSVSSRSRLSSWAVVSLVIGVMGAMGCVIFAGLPLGSPASLIAVGFGHFAFYEINKSQGKLTGKVQALIGLFLGYLGVIYAGAFVIILIVEGMVETLGF